MHECPKSVKNAGAKILKARRTARRLRDQIEDAIDAMEDTKPDMVVHGARNMEYGAARGKMIQAALADSLLEEAHDMLRKKLALYDCEEPSDDDIVGILGPGGGGR